VVALNRGRELRKAIPLIRARTAVDPERLRNPAIDVREAAARP
jgi:hypothetical protein